MNCLSALFLCCCLFCRCLHLRYNLAALGNKVHCHSCQLSRKLHCCVMTSLREHTHVLWGQRLCRKTPMDISPWPIKFDPNVEIERRSPSQKQIYKPIAYFFNFQWYALGFKEQREKTRRNLRYFIFIEKQHSEIIILGGFA